MDINRLNMQPRSPIVLVANAKALYPFILHFGGFWGNEEAYLTNIDDLVILTAPGTNLLRIWDIFHLFDHW